MEEHTHAHDTHVHDADRVAGRSEGIKEENACGAPFGIELADTAAGAAVAGGGGGPEGLQWRRLLLADQLLLCVLR